MKKKIIIFSSLAVVGVLSWILFWRTAKPLPQLRIMTYSSFASVFGPGQFIQKEFEKTCGCKIKWLKAPESTLILQRLNLKKDGFKTDVVMGLDQISLIEAKKLEWKTLSGPPSKDIIPLLRVFADENFTPYNWSPMTFLSKEKTDTLLLFDLLKKEYKNNISLPAPQMSTAGLQFYYWMWYVLKGQTADFLKKFKNQLYGLPPSWSTSYALFQRGHVDLSFSYLSSLLYHKQQNQKDFYPIFFKEGHPFQVELAGVSGFCTECGLAQTFINFLLTKKIQKILEEKNYMFPVFDLDMIQTTAPDFEGNFIKYNKLDLFLKEKEALLEQWTRLIKN